MVCLQVMHFESVIAIGRFIMIKGYSENVTGYLALAYGSIPAIPIFSDSS